MHEKSETAELKEYIIEFVKNGDYVDSIKLSIPMGEFFLDEIIPQVQALFDKIIALELAGKDISCSKGCSFCCKQLIPVSIPEVYFLDRLINSLPEGQQKLINSKFDSIMDKVKSAGLEKDFRKPTKNSNMDSNFFKLNLICPFLEEGICSIYEQRPLICREYHVHSPKSYCLDPYNKNIQKSKITRNIGSLMAVFSSHLYGTSRIPVPMVFLRKWIDENNTTERKKWPGIWLFNKIIDCLIGLNDESLKLVVTTK